MAFSRKPPIPTAEILHGHIHALFPRGKDFLHGAKDAKGHRRNIDQDVTVTGRIIEGLQFYITAVMFGDPKMSKEPCNILSGAIVLDNTVDMLKEAEKHLSGNDLDRQADEYTLGAPEVLVGISAVKHAMRPEYGLRTAHKLSGMLPLVGELFLDHAINRDGKRFNFATSQTLDGGTIAAVEKHHSLQNWLVRQ